MKLNNLILVLVLIFSACSEEKNKLNFDEVLLEYTPTLKTKKEAFEFREIKINFELDVLEKMYRETTSPVVRKDIYDKILNLKNEKTRLEDQLKNIRKRSEESMLIKHDAIHDVKDEYLNDKTLQSKKISYPFHDADGKPLLYPDSSKLYVVSDLGRCDKFNGKWRKEFDMKNVWRLFFDYPQVFDIRTPAGRKFWHVCDQTRIYADDIPVNFLEKLAKEIDKELAIKDIETLYYKFGYQRPDQVERWNKF